VDDLANLLVSPLSFGVLLLMLVLLAWRRSGAPVVRNSSALVLLIYALVTIPALPFLAGRALSWGYRPLVRVPATARVIVLLGGGQVNIGQGDGQLPVLTSSSAERVLEAVRVYRLLGDPWVISSGGTRHAGGDDRPNAVTMRSALIQLGVRADRILLETRSATTHDEAVVLAPILRELHAEHGFVLVTSRVHMRRAEATFRAAGLEPLPSVATDFVDGDNWSDYLIPDLKGLEFSRAVLHEVMGLLYYRWRGWTRPHDATTSDRWSGWPAAVRSSWASGRTSLSNARSVTSSPSFA
jgi:uncharacterized SAM-binding protein YcdF (DUF218 family)